MNILYYQILVSTTYLKKIKSYQINKSRLSGPRWNDEFESSVTSYSVLGIPDYLEYVNRKHETPTDNRPAQISINIIENKIF